MVYPTWMLAKLYFREKEYIFENLKKIKKGTRTR